MILIKFLCHQVLRRQPPGKLLKSAHAVDREFRVMNALQNTDVPVPRMYHLCEDRDVVGSMFYIMEFCQGRIFWDAAIPEVDNAQRTAMYDEMNRVLAALHEGLLFEASVSGKWAEIGASTSPSECSDSASHLLSVLCVWGVLSVI